MVWQVFNILFWTSFAFYIRGAATTIKYFFESSIQRDSEQERYPEDPRDKVENFSVM